jgi:amino acid adenylation domain-containing protein
MEAMAHDGIASARDPKDQLLAKAQEHQLIANWNATEQDYPRDKCVHQLVMIQAARTPDAPAIVAGNQWMSYSDLDQRSNRLAHHLQSFGVGPNVPVGLCVGRSMDMFTGLLGILKAGGAYVPCDPAFPDERIAFMFHDAAVPVVVTQRCHKSRFARLSSNVICLDGDDPTLAARSTATPPMPATAVDLAYIVYTSGSTGHPKGVEITHGSLLNLIFWHQHAFAVGAADRATQLASPAFDATGWEIWPYLTCGASVYLPDDAIRVSPTALRDWLIAQEITITFLPTLLAESLMHLAWPATCALRYVLTGADALQHYPSPQLPFTLVNNYGPSEATVLVTSGPVPPLAESDMAPTLGRPIANTQIYILDEHLEQVPIGMIGEIYIGGAGLARGYLNRPDLTKARFVADPFCTQPGARLYKTGDLGRFLPDGQLAFVGRVDDQIKIRGYRIEPQEIVAALNAHPTIASSYVLASDDDAGDKRLYAYIVLAAGTQVTAAEMREALCARLPDYMVPAAFVPMAALPMTANGKVDRSALPAPDATNTLQAGVAEQFTHIQARIARIVTSLLHIESVGMDDNFFFLGGHSLLGTQLITQIADGFGVTLPLRTLFDAPTIRKLSAVVEAQLLAKMAALTDEEVSALLG